MSTKEEKVAQDKHQIQLFANLLLPEPCPDGSVAHLFGLPSKSCSWQKGAAGFSSAAAAMDEKGDDVYFGVALRRVGLGKVSRGNAEDCTHALGVGIDIDVGVDGHGGSKKRFSTVEAALDCAAGAVALPPTMIVHSGGGLHLAPAIVDLGVFAVDRAAARAGGIDVRAVTVWALLGSFDWNSPKLPPSEAYALKV